MTGEYDIRLVALSIGVAVLASYTALELAGRIASSRHWRRFAWLGGGSVCMGSGIWAMHFVGMLAFRLPIDMGYDVFLTAVSWFLAVAASTVALYVVSRANLSIAGLLFGAAFMAVGIGSMHYTGMYAMRMQPGIDYDPLLVAASFGVAFGASLVALWLGFYLRDAHALRDLARKLGAALLMGVAIAGMHYTAMAAARFLPGSVCGAATELDTVWLAILIGTSTVVLLGVALLVSTLDRRFDTGTAELVTSLSQANAELRYLSGHDPLTALPNRTLLDERIRECLQAWHYYNRAFAIIYIDLDGFKAINDNLGHHFGDGLLQRLADAMQATLTAADTVARIGGDEFVVLLADVRRPAYIEQACRRLLAAIQAVDAEEAELSASIGFALCPQDGMEPGALLSAADTAMYAAKRAGKNRFERYRADMGARMSEDFQLQTELRAAIRSDTLTVYFQPKYRTHDRALVGAEALVRWPHPERGFVPPDQFIPIAERCGLITELEIRVLTLVGEHIRAWLDQGLVVPPISVNLSAVRIRDDALLDQVRSCLESFSLSPSQLSFEITETLAVSEIVKARSALGRLRSLGISVALDDFGTGHSSLFYLKKLPIQQIKIDRSFISDLPCGANQRAEIVEWIIGLAHRLQLRVVAEGVETEDQLDYLERVGCDEVQGFLLSRPLAADVFGDLVARAGAT